MKTLLGLIAASIAAALMQGAESTFELPHKFERGVQGKAEHFNQNFEYLLQQIRALRSENYALRQANASSSALPVGSIIASMLSPVDFAHHYGPSWILADGSEVNTRSAYYRTTGQKNVPDLRGVFLRGINRGRDLKQGDPAGERPPGDFQPDALVAHSHMVNIESTKKIVSKSPGDHKEVPHLEKKAVSTDVTGKEETRPRNVAVYYYIKVG